MFNSLFVLSSDEILCIFFSRLHVLHWQNTHTYQSISEDLLDRVRTRLLTEVVFTVGLETFLGVVENTDADKLCLLVKDFYDIKFILCMHFPLS